MPFYKKLILFLSPQLVAPLISHYNGGCGFCAVCYGTKGQNVTSNDSFVKGCHKPITRALTQTHYNGTNPNPLQGHYHILADCDTTEVAHPLIESACLPTFAPDCITLEGCLLCSLIGSSVHWWESGYKAKSQKCSLSAGPCIDRKVVPA